MGCIRLFTYWEIAISNRLTILHSLLPLASNLAAEQVDNFCTRFADSLLSVANSTVRPGESCFCFSCYDQLKKNHTLFCQTFLARLQSLLKQELHYVDSAAHKTIASQNINDLMLISLNEMEDKVVIGNLGQVIEQENSALLAALNLRMGFLLELDEMTTTQNPFRPQIFLQAVYDAWIKIDISTGTEYSILRQLRPEIFVPFIEILNVINAHLKVSGVLPDLNDAYRLRKSKSKSNIFQTDLTDSALYHKLWRWLVSSDKAESFTLAPAMHATPTENVSYGGSDAGMQAKVNPDLIKYLTALQKQQLRQVQDSGQNPAVLNSDGLRQIKTSAPPGSLTVVDEHTIDLLVKTFDLIFVDQHIPTTMKGLLGKLQIPLLKAALKDKEFFIKIDHPARILLEKITQVSAICKESTQCDDPMYQMIEKIIDHVEREFDEQLELFSDAVADLEVCMQQEQRVSENALADVIAEATQQEKLRIAQEQAEQDVALRIETGEVAGFVEVFLEKQWVQVLTLAHSVKDSKPDTLEKVRYAMDDLIWSVKPKATAEKRKQFIAKLPVLLSLLNAWLNVIKWNDVERVQFFSDLAERHAAIVRAPMELPQRMQLEMVMYAAQKASDRELSKRAKKLQEKPADAFTYMVNDMEIGEWVQFLCPDQSTANFRLSWISPMRTRFVFGNPQGEAPFSLTVEELIQVFQEHKATIIPMYSVIERALGQVLSEIA